MRKKNTASTALAATPEPASPATATPPALLSELRELIVATRQNVAQTVNSALVLLYWHVGQRLRTEVLKVERAEYGKEILSTLSKEWVAEFGRGFSWPNLSRMMALAEAFPDHQKEKLIQKSPIFFVCLVFQIVNHKANVSIRLCQEVNQ